MTVGVDWLAFTLKGQRVDEVKVLVAEYLGGEFVDLEHGGKRYQRMAVGTGGAKVYWSPGRDDVHVEMPGRAVGSLSEAQLRGLLLVAGTMGKATRVDLCADDFSRVIEPRQVYEAAGSAVTHTNRDKWRMEESRDGGATCYIGSRSSRQFLRVYNKAVESAGHTDSIRWELEFKKEAAEFVSGRLVRDDWRGIFCEHLVQVVDFRDRVPGKRGDRSRRLEWYEAIVGAASKATVRYPEPVQSLDGADAWLRKYVAPTLATVFEGRGGDVGYLEGLLEEGRIRQKTRHRALLAEARDGEIDTSGIGQEDSR